MCSDIIMGPLYEALVTHCICIPSVRPSDSLSVRCLSLDQHRKVVYKVEMRWRSNQTKTFSGLIDNVTLSTTKSVKQRKTAGKQIASVVAETTAKLMQRSKCFLSHVRQLIGQKVIKVKVIRITQCSDTKWSALPKTLQENGFRSLQSLQGVFM